MLRGRNKLDGFTPLYRIRIILLAQLEDRQSEVAVSAITQHDSETIYSLSQATRLSIEEIRRVITLFGPDDNAIRARLQNIMIEREIRGARSMVRDSTRKESGIRGSNAR